MGTVAYLLRALKEERELWQVAANKEGRTLISWIKFHLNKAAAKANRGSIKIEDVTLDKCKDSEAGCRNCLWRGIECKGYAKFGPKITTNNQPSCTSYYRYCN